MNRRDPKNSKQELEQRHEVSNTAEDQRRSRRVESAKEVFEKAGLPISSLVLHARGATQRSVKFIRWLRQAIRDRLAEAVAVTRLKALYATL
jgi:tRNA A37 N6-isopentenylltransferase MiaA